MLCNQCPRQCNATRTATENIGGICGMPNMPMVARADLHFWEEPSISGTNGSGTIFFSGCSLHCVFCQNSDISTINKGKLITIEGLSNIFKKLEQKGAHNINLVTPTHFVDSIICALDLYRPSIPIVYNSSGYETIDTLKRLEGYVDIFLMDFKYINSEKSKIYSNAIDYPKICIGNFLSQTLYTLCDETYLKISRFYAIISAEKHAAVLVIRWQWLHKRGCISKRISKKFLEIFLEIGIPYGVRDFSRFEQKRAENPCKHWGFSFFYRLLSSRKIRQFPMGYCALKTSACQFILFFKKPCIYKGFRTFPSCGISQFSRKVLAKIGVPTPPQFHTEGYRSGHNEAVLKTVWVHAHVGSNPTPSANFHKNVS